MNTDLIVQSLSILTIAAQIIALLLLLKVIKWERVAANSTKYAFIVALIATAGSLTFSEVFHWEPCKLCWFQRIFMYPLVILLAMALAKKHTKQITDYVLALAYPGALVAAWHYFIQRTDFLIERGLVSCSAAGQAASCSGTFVLHFGYITIPMMALTAFVLIILLMHAAKKYG